VIDGHALGAVGLSPAEEDAYRMLLAHADLAPPALAEGLGIPIAEADRLLIALTNRGLAKMVADDSFTAAPPESSIVALLGERLDGLRRGYAAVDEMERVYRASRAGYGGVPNSETITGLRAIASQLTQLNAQARQEVRMFMRHPIITTDGGNISDSPADESIRYRTLYEKALLDDADVLELIRRSAKRGVQIRFAGALPVKLLVVDDRVALIMGPGTQPVALRTEHPALVACAVSLFEQIWSTAVPAPINGDVAIGPHAVSGPSDPDDRLLLSLLLAGLTDQAIAARLGVGLRTVQRRVRDLMDAASVDTRIQLGWQASRKGWVV
jgi:predicted transcriptional regulator